jgi:hypothetical protein
MVSVYILRIHYCRDKDIQIYKVGITSKPFKTKTTKYSIEGEEIETFEEEFTEHGIMWGCDYEVLYDKIIEYNGDLEELENRLINELSDNFIHHAYYEPGTGHFEGSYKDIKSFIEEYLRETPYVYIYDKINENDKIATLEDRIRDQYKKIEDLNKIVEELSEVVEKLNGKPRKT